MKRMILPVLVTLGVLTAPALALRPGDVAPPLTNVTWLRGEPIRRYEPGHIYVLDFWATWCGPCIASFPKLIKLSKDYEAQNVHVVSIAVWPRRGQQPTRAFIAKRPDMDFHIVEDDRAGATARTFLASSGVNSIPHAIVIDGSGKIAWIGHPAAGMEKVVGAITAGEFDLDQFVRQEAREQAQKVEMFERVRELNNALIAARDAGDHEGQLPLAQEMLELDPTLYPHLGVYRYYLLLVKLNRSAEAASYADQLIDETFAEIPRGLDTLAIQIAVHEEIPDEKRDLDLALRAATRSNELGDWQDATSLDTIARVHFVLGDIDKAIELQKQALEQATPSNVRDQIESALVEYRKAQSLAIIPDAPADDP